MDMRKMATVFIVAVLVPTLVLAWLAMRSLRDQEIVANSQRAILHQSSTEALAADLNTFLDDVRVFFRQLVNDLVEENGINELSQKFDQIAPNAWSQCLVASVVMDDGEILCPLPTTTDPRARAFLELNARFLLNQTNAKVYEAAPVNNVGPVITENRINLPSAVSGGSEKPASRVVSAPAKFKKQSRAEGPVQYKVEVAEQKLRSYNPFRRMAKDEVADVFDEKLSAAQADKLELESHSLAKAPVMRNVQPSQSVVGKERFVQQNIELDNISNLEWGIGNLNDIVAGKAEGALSRFVHDGLHVLLWNRHTEIPDRIFWVELDLNVIKRDLDKIVTGYSSNSDICLALLDAEGAVVSKTDKTFETDWSKPFVASEVGQILPHWEVAAYLIDPDKVNRAAKTAKLTLWLLVPTLLTAIACGTFLIFRSIGMEMQMARRKTDFVSNVSHELKTPLTSIRMFSDMLSDGAMCEKDREYSGIISREAARLTRLINNLLDFSRLERTVNPYSKELIDLAELTSETVETYRMQIEADGCHLLYNSTLGSPAKVLGDRDALSQVLLNLLSNAEKYGCLKGEIEIRLAVDEPRGTAEWQVLDRGEGIDRKYSSRIFEKFFRIDDSLTNGVPGSGLGLALARQIVNHHGGEISFRNREGGGCCFSVTLPIVIDESNHE
ncbi:MAG: HAMP domain-containing sensor histidine kinase [Verrucomicrobiales bacterium]|nr:HAMP domain-containing sensor histidine kinase [Verrucomicrobiales bacterium]